MTELANFNATLSVPAGYAEKAMASLMQLHNELMDEKERRVDLFRKLMEREQALAELKSYVKMLEEKLAPPRVPDVVVPAPEPVAATPATPPRTPPQPPRVAAAARPRTGDWKLW